MNDDAKPFMKLGKNRRTVSTKEHMERELVRLGSKAAVRLTRSTAFVPDLEFQEDLWRSPYNGKDQLWWALFFEMLGTRMAAFVDTIFNRLNELIPEKFDKESQKWIPDVPAIRAALAIIQGMEVENEAQCAYALQLVALHLSTMQLGQATTKVWGGDPRSVAVMAKATRAYGDGLLNLKRLQGKGQKRSTQIIKVEKHEHYHQHLHTGGGAEIGGRVHAKDGGDCGKQATPLLETSAEVRSDNAAGSVVPFPKGEGPPALPDARGRSRKWRANG